MQRSIAFSGKKKKEQLRERKQQKQAKAAADSNDLFVETVRDRVRNLKLPGESDGNRGQSSSRGFDKRVLDRGDESSKKKDQDRLRTVFELDTKEDIQQRIHDSRRALDLSLRHLGAVSPPLSNVVIDIPARPEWSYAMSLEEVETSERRVFSDWLRGIYERFPANRLNYFEHNIEVWRQLWRVCERSDILLLVADARYPIFQFAPAVYRYVVKELRKPLVLVLNKIDLVPQHNLEEWVAYLKALFPALKVVCFTSHPNPDPISSSEGGEQSHQKRKKRRVSVGVEELLEACGEKLADLLQQKREMAFSGVQTEEEEEEEPENSESEGEGEEKGDDKEEEEEEESDTHHSEHHQHLEDNVPGVPVYTIGTIGYPNVGKSSLINGLMGKKVVSTSRTPGHTKHFQTITLSPNVSLCDCPGLVFPALDQSKALQVICGVFPIAQVREPYSAVRFLAERIPLEHTYNLPPPEDNQPWSPWLICEQYALMKGYRSKGGRPDTYRAGNEILRDNLDGRLAFSFRPPTSFLGAPVEARQVDYRRLEAKEDNSEDLDDTEEDICDEEEISTMYQKNKFDVLGDEC
mmetsp:Transcript_8218/g.13349  ORF Transcript_8218/g.13349 Transcript_8218/m.13349 type:complete len:578 (-) Transcript_8218:45-1778(-)|eukprot:CAMPEP_0184661686 /NCGR_PEP_ID=MMETSP0308-20130426/39595_1 /TAXON_ID=38269 /ORGANISM="Gloeochaete witrockiana, Strain SAG 46.84" /LENGTH=577 /DNA_ID=CAMNT_0027103163 /DNA_START=61 /DNA_END=1794 /DNA_ORIENTATION=+